MTFVIEVTTRMFREAIEDDNFKDGDLEQIIASCENELMRRAGKEAGKARASWFFDGNRSSPDLAHLMHLWNGIEGGDPGIMDFLPAAQDIFSGEWAGSPRWDETVESILNRPYNEEHNPDYDRELYESWQMAFDDAAQEAVSHELNERITNTLVNMAAPCSWCGTMIFQDPRDRKHYTVYVNAPPKLHTCGRTA